MTTTLPMHQDDGSELLRPVQENFWQRLKLFLTPFDARYEDMTRDNWYKIAFRDTSAGLLVAMMAIPMAMGFAIASGLRPEHGIVAGAVAGLVGALFGGSKYNVYGPAEGLMRYAATLAGSTNGVVQPFTPPKLVGQLTRPGGGAGAYVAAGPSHLAADARATSGMCDSTDRAAPEEFRFVHLLDDSARQTTPSGRAAALDELRGQVDQHRNLVPHTGQVSYEIIKDPAAERLMQYAAEQETDLMWVGHTRGHIASQALVRQLVLRSPSAVWVVPPGVPPTVRRILVPIDFSERSAEALRVAADLARRFGLRQCLTLHVYFPNSRLHDDRSQAFWRDEKQQAWEKFVAAIDIRGIDVVPLFREGLNVSRHIVEVAGCYEVDLVVMATRGRSRAAGVLLENVTAQTVRDCRMPLLALKPTGSPLRLLPALRDKLFTPRDAAAFDC